MVTDSTASEAVAPYQSGSTTTALPPAPPLPPPLTNHSALEYLTAMMIKASAMVPVRVLYHHLEAQWRTLRWIFALTMVLCAGVPAAFFIYYQVVQATYQFRATGALVEALVILAFLALNGYVVIREIRFSRREWVDRVNALVQRIFTAYPRFRHGSVSTHSDGLVGRPQDITRLGTPPSLAGFDQSTMSAQAKLSCSSTTNPNSGNALPIQTSSEFTESNLLTSDGPDTNSQTLTRTPLNTSISAYLVIRERRVTLIPAALLCRGDYVVLSLGETLPGDAEYVGPWVHPSTQAHAKLLPLPNDFYEAARTDPDLLRLPADQKFTLAFLTARGIPAVTVPSSESSTPMTAEEQRDQHLASQYGCQHVFRLTVTPYSDDLNAALGYDGCPNSVLDNQILNIARLAFFYILPLCILLSLAINLIRFVFLDVVSPRYDARWVTPPDGGGTEALHPGTWRQAAFEYLGTFQVYLVMPFGVFVLPWLLIIVRTYANAQLLILLDALQHSTTDYEDSDDIDEFDVEAPPPTKDITVAKTAVWSKFLELVRKSDYRNLSRSNRLLESLGNTTVICAVDRDGTLTRPFPAVDQILFIDRTNSMVSVNVTEDKIYSNGVAFEDTGWEQHLASLKPLGLNFLLNSNCGATLGRYRLDPHKRQNPLQHFCKIDAGQQTCLCRIGHEIGFTTDALRSFVKLEQLSVLAPHHPSLPVLSSQQDPATPSILSTVYREKGSGTYQLLSDGQVPLLLDLCTDYWDGEQIRPMTLTIKQEILELFQNALENDIQTVGFAYRPLEADAVLPDIRSADQAGGLGGQHARAVLLGPRDHERTAWRWLYRKPARPFDMTSRSSAARPGSPPPSCNTSVQDSPGADVPDLGTIAEHVRTALTTQQPLCIPAGEEIQRNMYYKRLVQGQIFLGLTTLCPVPKVDVCDVIEDLDLAGIRFVYFSQARERESKAFAERLGLATDWNSCILLSAEVSQDTFAEGVDHQEGLLQTAGYLEDHDVKTHLPRGIENIRPHLENVDDIPLQVSLFAEANWEAVREMFRIYHDYGEVVCCIGSGLKDSNPMTFASADFAIAVDPFPMGFRGLYRSMAGDSPSPWANLPTTQDMASSFLLGAELTSLPCSLAFQHDSSLYVLTQIIREARWLLSCIRQGGCFVLGIHLAVVLCQLLAYSLLLPPMFQGFHCLWLLCFIVPLLSVPFLFVTHEANIMTTMQGKNQVQLQQAIRLLVYGLWSFALPILGCGLTYLIALQALLGTGYHGYYHTFIYLNWTALRTDSQWAIMYAQTLTSGFFTYYLTWLSASFLYRTHSLVSRPPWCNTCWLCIVPLVWACQAVFTTATLIAGPNLMPRLPWYYYVVAFSWPAIFMPFQELVKWHDKKHVVLWKARQQRDPYVKAAQSQQLRARSAFKLRDMDSRYGLLQSGMVVVDCGAAPGGWSTILADKVYPPDTLLPKPQSTTPADDHDNTTARKEEEVRDSPCQVLAIDLLPMQPIPGVHFFQMDFTKPESVQRLLKALGGRPVDLVVSDMAPSFSGNRSVDHLRTMALCEDALVFADQVLRPQGSFVCKFIAGGTEQEFRRMLATKFEKVHVCKPKSSRKESA
ncbi:hypothetical protein IWQ62_003564, partial [Dispira parvispora]